LLRNNIVKEKIYDHGAIEASPESPTAKKLASMIEKRIETYDKPTEKHGLSKEGQERLLKKVADFSDY